MTTIITSTIGTGGTYTTVAAWWASLPASLVTADEVHIGQLLNQEHDCTPTITFSGKAVDATRYAELTAAPGASWTDMPLSPMRYGFGARIVTNYDYGIGFFLDAGQVVRLSKFQVTNLGTGYTLDAGASGGGASNLDRLLVEGRAAGNAFAGVAQIGGAFAKQCVFIRTANFADAPVLVSRSELYGCTIVNLGTTVSNAVVGDYDTGKVVKNCAIFGATNALGGSTTWAASGCVTDDATPPSGAVTAVFSTSTGAKFGNITAGTHDLRTTSGSALIGAGVQDLTNSAADAYGTTRKNPPDAGAFESPPPPASVTLNANMDVFTSALALAEFIPSSLVISANMDVFISGMALAQAPGVINFGPLKNGSGFRWDRSDITAIIQDRTTGAVLATLTGVTSGASGGQLSSLSIQSGGLYRVSFRIPAGGLLPNGAKGEADLSGA